MSMLFDAFCAAVDPFSSGGYYEHVKRSIEAEMKATAAAQKRAASFSYTASGKRVFDTGKVAIGLRYEPPAQRQGQDADAIQQALLWSQATPKVRPWGKPWWWGMADAVWHLWRWVRGMM